MDIAIKGLAMDFQFKIGNIIKIVIISLATHLLISCHRHENKKVAPLFSNISNYLHKIKTYSPLAQRYFNQGMVLFYSFEYGEAIRSFKGAINADPECAMCYWGLSLALGSK